MLTLTFRFTLLPAYICGFVRIKNLGYAAIPPSYANLDVNPSKAVIISTAIITTGTSNAAIEAPETVETAFQQVVFVIAVKLPSLKGSVAVAPAINTNRTTVTEAVNIANNTVRLSHLFSVSVVSVTFFGLGIVLTLQTPLFR
jgi:hypothetical protein